MGEFVMRYQQAKSGVKSLIGVGLVWCGISAFVNVPPPQRIIRSGQRHEFSRFKEECEKANDPKGGSYFETIECAETRYRTKLHEKINKNRPHGLRWYAEAAFWEG